MFPEREIFDVRRLKAGLLAEKIALYYLKPFYPKRGWNKEIHFRKFTLAGRADFIVNGWVVEVKKSNFKKLRPEWMAQINLYMLLENADKGILMEVGNGRIRTTKMSISPDLIRRSIDYFSSLENFISRKVTPSVQRNRSCRFCSFRHLCISSKQ
jgi:CRISPR/Cas system-associated exonuclease Cas4 (RecB family)